MMKVPGIACLVLSTLGLGGQQSVEDGPGPAEQVQIAETVGALFDEIATATNQLEFGRLLGLYQESEELTYVARGRINRSYATFSEIMDAQFGGVTGANLEFTEKYIDVLSSDVAVVTAGFQFTATLVSGDSASSSGTFTCIYVLRNGTWAIQHSSHTFPTGI